MRPTTPEISGCAASPAWSSTVRSSGATTVSRTPLSGPLLLLCLELDLEAVGRGLTEVVGEGGGDRLLSLLAGRGGLLERLLSILGDRQRDLGRRSLWDLRAHRRDRELLGLRGDRALGRLRRLARALDIRRGVLVRARHGDAHLLERLLRRVARQVAGRRVERLPGGVEVEDRRRVAGERRDVLVQARGVGEEDVGERTPGFLPRERDPRAVGGEHGPEVTAPARQLRLIRAVRTHDPEIDVTWSTVPEDDPLPVGREVGVAVR